jgi:hypothetical protein
MSCSAAERAHINAELIRKYLADLKELGLV